MPPKKVAASNGDAGEGSGKFTWEGLNDYKLLLLTQGRYVKTDEYEQLSSALPGTTAGSIRNRISTLRVRQRNMYEEHGWELPEGGAGHSAKKSKKEKRAADDEAEMQTPTKKPRAKQAAKATETEGKGSDEDDGMRVKEENVEEA